MNWWRYLDYICNGRRAPSGETYLSAPVVPGTRLRADDRDYVVTRTGAWERATPKRAFKRPARESQIRVPPKGYMLYPCGCAATSGRGGVNPPPYCPRHGTPDDPSAAKCVAAKRAAVAERSGEGVNLAPGG